MLRYNKADQIVFSSEIDQNHIQLDEITSENFNLIF